MSEARELKEEATRALTSAGDERKQAQEEKYAAQKLIDDKQKELETIKNEQEIWENTKKKHYEKLEDTIQNTLLLAQNAADQAKESSQKEADLIMKNANESAQKVLDKAHNDVIAVNDEYEKVKEEFIKFRAKFRNFMNAQLQTFDELEKDLTKNYNVSETVEELELSSKDIHISEEKLDAVVEEDNSSEEMKEIKSFFANN